MEDNRKRELEESDNEEVEVKRIKLRCEYANVKVIVGGEKQEGTDDDEDKDEENKDDASTNNNDNETTTEKKVFWHYSQILASHSRYVDALLSAPLAAAASRNTETKNSEENEKSNNNNDNDTDNNETSIDITEISFPDISPSQWERMINFVTDPAAALDMTKEDAMESVILYDKYDFHTGLKLCDKILTSMFYSDEAEFKMHMHDLELLDRCVQVVVLSHEKNLKKTLEHGLAWLHDLFYEYTPECVILTVDHIRELVPVIVCHKAIQKAIGIRLSEDNIDVHSPMFPAFFVANIQLIVARNTTLLFVNQILISNCDQVAGTYDADITDDNSCINGTCTYFRDDFVYSLKKNEIGDWIIEKDIDSTLLFICKGSRCEALPPEEGWKKVDDDNNIHRQNRPVLSYHKMFDDGSGGKVIM